MHSFLNLLYAEKLVDNFFFFTSFSTFETMRRTLVHSLVLYLQCAKCLIVIRNANANDCLIVQLNCVVNVSEEKTKPSDTKSDSFGFSAKCFDVPVPSLCKASSSDTEWRQNAHKQLNETLHVIAQSQGDENIIGAVNVVCKNPPIIPSYHLWYLF